jgi:hypothetical protein
MKKIILTLAIIFTFITVDAQISFGVATQYQISKPDQEWPGWQTAESPVLIYIDLGFGFAAIENGYHDRFIIKTLDKVGNYSDRNRYQMKCVDKERKPCTLYLTQFSSGNTSLEIHYNDIEYAYFVDGEMDASGYPFQYFNKDTDNSSTSGSKKLEGVTL